MTRRVELRPGVREEIEDAAGWYEAERPGLGLRFLDAIEAAIEQARDAPGTAPASERDPAVHRRVVQRFPYVIFYVAADDVVTIVAVAHGRRRPGYWNGR